MAISALAVAGVLATGAPAHAQVVTIAELRPQHTSGMCLDVAHMSHAHTARVIQGNCSGGANQLWLRLNVGEIDVP